MSVKTPNGMTRRHFMEHMAAATALTAPTAGLFANAMRANAADLQRRKKACILLFMNGGPPTIDIWDMKPGQPTGGPFKPISTAGDVQINENLPKMAKLMNRASIIRSMSTREADHTRGKYYMHTGYVPNPNVDYPSYGAVIAHELAEQSKYMNLEIPPFVSIGGSSAGPGFLGMSYAPFVVDTNGDVRNLDVTMDRGRLADRMAMLAKLEKSFAGASERELARGEPAYDHGKVLQSTVNLMTSKQMDAFKVDKEPKSVQELYGLGATGGGMAARQAGFAKGCLMARRLVETGVPFVEVDMGGWDLHDNLQQRLKDNLAVLDSAMSGLIMDLEQRGMLQDTTIVWMGDFGRTPRLNSRGGRDHWARSWSTVVAGGPFKHGIAVGETSADGTAVESDPYSSQDLMASVLKSMGVSLETVFTSKNNRPMKIANSGRVIKELFA